MLVNFFNKHITGSGVAKGGGTLRIIYELITRWCKSVSHIHPIPRSQNQGQGKVREKLLAPSNFGKISSEASWNNFSAYGNKIIRPILVIGCRVNTITLRVHNQTVAWVVLGKKHKIIKKPPSPYPTSFPSNMTCPPSLSRLDPGKSGW